MSEKSPIIILLAVADPAIAARLRDALSGPEFRLVSATEPAEAGEIGPRTLADVIIVADGQPLALDRPYQRLIERGETSLLCIGSECGALVALFPSDETLAKAAPTVFIPPDAVDRELVLACRLLGENARLRRRIRREHRSRGRLARLADSDPLTGLPNRRAWQRELRRRVRDDGPAVAWQCLAIVDLDYFKQVNVTHGHAAGDRVLADTGRALRDTLRTGDMVARLGGDEFALIFQIDDEHAAKSIVERVRARVNAVAIDDMTTIRASAGFVVFAAREDLDVAALTAAADQALRLAKAGGRNRAVAAEGVP